MINFSESGHPTFRATSALEQVTLQSKGGGTLSTNFCGDYDNVELFFRTVVSVNHFSMYGAVFVRGIHPSISEHKATLFSNGQIRVTGFMC